MTDRSLDQRIAECGKQMAIAAVPVFTVSGAVHPPTLVAACARMAGTYMFRSFRLRAEGMAPGNVVLSEQASAQTPVLLRTCAAVLATLGRTLPPAPTELIVDEKATPRLEFLETQRRLDPVFAPLKSTFALDDAQMARAAAVATGIAVHTVAKHLDHVIGFGLAAYSFMEGSRTVPESPGAAGDAV